MSHFAIVELHKEELKFSAGHFMVFSEHHRESLHGHDYQVHVAFRTEVIHNGMAFDCRDYKHKIMQLCQLVDYKFILPGQSDYLAIEDAGDRWVVCVGAETIPFLKKDAVVLPICNATLEELSRWFLLQLFKQPEELKAHHIHEITVKVFNGRGESGASTRAV